MLKKINITLMVLVITMVCFTSVYTYIFAADTHLLGFSAVDGKEIRYQQKSKYGDAFNHAKSQWNSINQSKCHILADKWYTVCDLEIFDTYRSDVTWSGQYQWRGGTADADHITLNRYYCDRPGWNPKRTITHEVGHAIGINDHYDSVYSGNIMYGYYNGVDILQPHDKEDFNMRFR